MERAKEERLLVPSLLKGERGERGTSTPSGSRQVDAISNPWRSPFLLSRSSLAHGLEQNSFGTLAIPLAVEDALPGAEVEAAGGDGDDDLVADREGAEVGGGVVLARAGVVPVVARAPGRDAVLQPVED